MDAKKIGKAVGLFVLGAVTGGSAVWWWKK